MSKRSLTYKKRWKELTDYYGCLCFYCHKEIATTIDHVVPYSFDQDNDIENLVPACALCNSLASDMIFDDVEQKRQYILRKRKTHINRTVICVECLIPFSYRIHSPSLFLCAECYDAEYRTKLSKTSEWKRWQKELRSAGIPVEAHRELKKYGLPRNDRDGKLELLVDEYSKIVDTDDEFAEMLMII